MILVVTFYTIVVHAIHLMKFCCSSSSNRNHTCDSSNACMYVWCGEGDQYVQANTNSFYCHSHRLVGMTELSSIALSQPWLDPWQLRVIVLLDI